MHTYATTKKLKKIPFRINSQNIKQRVFTRVTFISEIKPQKKGFLAKYVRFFRDLCVHFEHLLGLEYAYVCHDLRTEKESI